MSETKEAGVVYTLTAIVSAPAMIPEYGSLGFFLSEDANNFLVFMSF